MTKTPAPAQYVDVSESERPTGSGLDAYDAIYEREHEYVWRTLGRLGVPVSELADATHDVFVVLWLRWGNVDLARPIRPWLFGVARKVAATVRRKQQEIIDAEVPTVEDARVAQRDLLWRALAAIDEDRRAILILHDLEGHTGAEIAEMLNVPVNTVHSRLRLGRADLVEAVRRLRGTP